jgi:hypothetical protein
LAMALVTHLVSASDCYLVLPLVIQTDYKIKT